ncbi:Polyprenol monophosphomannose synthase [bioreactor metagenome]|uniref:Polyprenol monophosphomannose synthase n=1 Tax=bioreactor metagenome TaxID=1076179 RepID=A0A645ADU5_9ZZZZ
MTGSREADIIHTMYKSTLVIIPAFNEEENIVKTVQPFLDEACPYDYIIVNDGSSDCTKQVCLENQFKLLDLECNVGLSYAVKAGMIYAKNHGYSYALQFDGDGQHEYAYIQELFDPISQNLCDIAIGSRFLSARKKLSFRNIGGTVISFFIFLTSGVLLTDPTSGMRLYNRKMIELFAAEANMNPEPETLGYLLRKGVSVMEVPVHMSERMHGISMFSFGASITYMIKTVFSLAFIQWFRK